MLDASRSRLASVFLAIFVEAVRCLLTSGYTRCQLQPTDQILEEMESDRRLISFSYEAYQLEIQERE